VDDILGVPLSPAVLSCSSSECSEGAGVEDPERAGKEISVRCEPKPCSGDSSVPAATKESDSVPLVTAGVGCTGDQVVEKLGAGWEGVTVVSKCVPSGGGTAGNDCSPIMTVLVEDGCSASWCCWDCINDSASGRVSEASGCCRTAGL